MGLKPETVFKMVARVRQVHKSRENQLKEVEPCYRKRLDTYCLVVILIGILWTRDATHEVPLSHFTAKERATYDSQRKYYFIQHREKYPDCYDFKAIFEDADRFARWYLKDKAYRQKSRTLYEEWRKLTNEYNAFFDNFYLNMSEE